MNTEIQHQVDQLLLEQGEYLPLELLLQEGRLIYSDYEAWRNGEIDNLDKVIFGDPEQLSQLLQHAARYLSQRGWLAESISYTQWNNDAPKSLRFSLSTTLNNDFHLRYRKPEDQPQLDMFTDAPAVSLTNGIRQALIDRDIGEARRQIERLYDTAPDHGQLGALEHLVEAAEMINRPVDDIASELQTLLHTLIPLAEGVMGSQGRNLLIPLWRRLSAALHDHPFQADQPEQHRSFTAIQAMDWNEAQQAIEQEDGWQQNATLLQRHAVAAEHQHKTTTALKSWFALCWQFPEQGDMLECSPRQDFLRQRHTFLDLEPELPTDFFPAWLLIIKPELTQQSLAPSDAWITPPDSYCTLYPLLAQQPDDQASTSNDYIHLRAQLKQQSATLFHHFLHNTAT